MNKVKLRLIADIGGTNARFALATEAMKLSQIEVYRCTNYETLLDAIRAYLDQVKQPDVDHVVIAIANPVTGDHIQMTNHHWQFSIREMKAALAVETFLVINDFTAQALAVTAMTDDELTQVGGGQRRYEVPVAVVGPGTGLGVSGLIPGRDGRLIALSGEGGHVSFAPRDACERGLLAFAENRFGSHVSAERLLQGAGLVMMYQYFAQQIDQEAIYDKPADITHAALVDNDTLCLDVLQRYCMILGDVCANVVLTIGAIGGVFIAGGIVPRFIDFFQQSDFRVRFEDKGRFSHYLQPIPAYVVKHPQPGLLGAMVALSHELDESLPILRKE